ncbi:MAG: heavy-metal-associated domain-containing protein [Prevotellaceae bacterium]|nr:heavy-metal-associated domain-containing protein [Prevotellaceae bacterium]
MKKFAIMMMMLMMSICVFAKGDVKVVVFTPTPAMHCQNCEKKIKDNIRFVKGVKKIETSVEKQTITITYDAAKTTPEKIEAGFKKLGYKVKKK